MRAFTRYAGTKAKALLDVLADPSSSVATYKDAMIGLGQQFALALDPLVAKDSAICVACTAEDADYLARGLLEGLEKGGINADRLRLVCFWNARIRRFESDDTDSLDVAPIVKEYREQFSVADSTLIILKSIISGGCVVKTNLASLIEEAVPQRVFVVAPVMLEGAEKRLSSEFPDSTAKRFEYVTFAIDDQRGADRNVVPGIGGSVYERLGVPNVNALVPEIVKERRPVSA